MTKKVIIRADGGKEIGMGHLYRASLISDFLFKKLSLETILLIKKDDKSLKFLANKQVKIKVIPKNAELIQEIELIKNLIHKGNCCLFILDVLKNDVNIEFTNEIRSTNIPFAAITDDSNKRVINADVIINGNPCQEGTSYLSEKGRYFVGPLFFIMDNNYSRISTNIPSGEIRKILLTVGGSDHNDLIFKILEALNKLEYHFNIKLITSNGTGYIDRLKNFIKTCNNSIELLIDIPEIIKEWRNCDFAITAGGNTLFERIAARKPGLTICQLQRQMEIADKFAELGVNYNVGFGPELTAEEIASKLRSYLFQYDEHLVQYNKAPQYVDGKGLYRVSKIFINLIQ